MFSRRIRFWLVIGLLVSNLAVGILSLFFLRSVNERYAVLFERSVPLVNDLRTLTRELTGVQRLARRIVDPKNEPVWQELPPAMRAASEKSLGLAGNVSTAELFRGTPHGDAIVGMGREYNAKVGVFLALVRDGKLTEANQFNTETLRPTHDAFQVTLDAAADYVQGQSSDLRSRYAQDSRFFGGLLLAFAGWPVVAAGLLLLVLGLLVATLMITIFTPELGWTKRISRAGALER